MSNMSMKDQISEMIYGTGKGYVFIGDLAYLYREHRMWNGEPLDILKVHFNYVSGIKGGADYTIKARNLNEVIHEIDEYTRDYFCEVANAMRDSMWFD